MYHIKTCDYRTKEYDITVVKKDPFVLLDLLLATLDASQMQVMRDLSDPGSPYWIEFYNGDGLAVKIERSKETEETK